MTRTRFVSLFLGLLLTAQANSSKDSSLSPRDFLVSGLEDIEPSFSSFHGVMYAGLLPTRPFGQAAQGELMFWMFLPAHPTYSDTLTVWMNGGPGCSSLGGCLFEHCPVTMGEYAAGFASSFIDPNAPLQENEFGWTVATAMMYVEQPHGTGFSNGTFPNDETDVSRDFYGFMTNIYTVFEDLRAKRLFFAGESYAGMYVPSIAHYIHEQNKKNQGDFKMNLEGISLGNGWIDARTQGPAVIDYAWWHGMIDSRAAKAFHQEWENCRDGSDQPPPFHAFTVPDECNIMGAVMQTAGEGLFDWGKPNAYDVTTWGTYGFLDDNTGTMARFFNNPAVQDALNVIPHRSWIECMPGAGRRRLSSKDSDLPGKILLAHDEPISVVPYIADLLDSGIRVLVYNGDRDLTTNVQGSEMLLDSMEWSGAKGWADGSYTRGVWLVNNSLGGYVKTYKNLEFVVVWNSGHLVPMNRPKVALDLITRFLGNKNFVDKELPDFSDVIDQASPRKKPSRPARGFNFTAVLFGILGFFLGIFFHRHYPKGFPPARGYEHVPNVEGESDEGSERLEIVDSSSSLRLAV